MPMTRYDYASGDLLAAPNTYFFSRFEGTGFLRAWEASRRDCAARCGSPADRSAGDPLPPASSELGAHLPPGQSERVDLSPADHLALLGGQSAYGDEAWVVRRCRSSHARDCAAVAARSATADLPAVEDGGTSSRSW